MQTYAVTWVNFEQNVKRKKPIIKDNILYDPTYLWCKADRTVETESRIVFVEGYRARGLGGDHEWDTMRRNENMLKMVV